MMYDFDVRDVLKDKQFYRTQTDWLGRTKREEEHHRALYGHFLLRCELYRLKFVDLGFKDGWILKNLPEFHGAKINEATVLQQIEYLRADVILATARAQRKRIRSKDSV